VGKENLIAEIEEFQLGSADPRSALHNKKLETNE